MPDPGFVNISHDVAEVEDESTEVLAAGSYDRVKYRALQNPTDTDIWAMVGADAEVGKGIYLPAHVGFFEMSLAKGNLDVRAINAIHAATGETKNLLVMEGV